MCGARVCAGCAWCECVYLGVCVCVCLSVCVCVCVSVSLNQNCRPHIDELSHHFLFEAKRSGVFKRGWCYVVVISVKDRLCTSD